MLKGLSPDQFLATYWQKRALFLPAAIDSPLPVLDADEIAWLAMQADVESRLVFTKRNNGDLSYRVEHGPFSETELSELPTEDWTLLVQDVEKHLPDFRAYFALLPFIPAWRLDDLMVSIAAPGGSVGPHKDNYDVFLCQGDGTRHWSISDDRNMPVDASAEALSLLLPFQATEERDCIEGDVLYVPPGIPHWGVAQSLCTTYSIGMRAPTDVELAAGVSRIFDGDDKKPGNVARFYCDADLKACEATGGGISTASLQRLREQRLMDESLDDEQLITVLGSVVTDPKAWLDPDRPSTENVEKLLQGTPELQVHGMTLITWFENDDLAIVFVNGTGKAIPESAIELVRQLCLYRFAAAHLVETVVQEAQGREFLRWMIDQGLLDIVENSL